MDVHAKPSQRGSWDPHGMIGCYVGPVMNHYQCFRSYIPATRAERITDMVTFLPHKNVEVPAPTSADFIKQALQDILSIVKSPPNSTIPTSWKRYQRSPQGSR